MRKWSHVLLLAGLFLFLQIGTAQTQPATDTQAVRFNARTMSIPVLVHSADPVYTVEARRAKFQGACVVSLVVDSDGNPQDIRVVRPIGMGLDEKAIEAVRQYKFKPATMKESGVPVSVRLNVEVSFHLY
jgi:TonB family protein